MATIFLKSNSQLANKPPKSIVNKEISIIKPQTLINIKLNRINRKIPAVTKVEECTKEDTGVGAAIAAGSHAENGI